MAPYGGIMENDRMCPMDIWAPEPLYVVPLGEPVDAYGVTLVQLAPGEVIITLVAIINHGEN